MPAQSVKVTSKVKKEKRVTPRTPQRSRGIERFSVLLDATESLLNEHDPSDIGLYRIAQKAGIPPASVYHFFPTIEAAYLALAQRYFDLLAEVHASPMRGAPLQNWPDLMRLDHRRAAMLMNEHPAAIKLLYGGHGGVEIRTIDEAFLISLSDSYYSRLDTAFFMPHIRDPGTVFQIFNSISDAIWAISARRHGRITDEFLEESFEAALAYCRRFLPGVTDRREWLIEAAARDEMITLPMGLDEKVEDRVKG